MRLLEILDNREGLRNHRPIVLKRRDERLRIQLPIRLGAVLFTSQMHALGLVVEAFAVQRDPNAVGGRAPEIGEKLQRDPASLRPAGRAASAPPATHRASSARHGRTR